MNKKEILVGFFCALLLSNTISAKDEWPNLSAEEKREFCTVFLRVFMQTTNGRYDNCTGKESTGSCAKLSRFLSVAHRRCVDGGPEGCIKHIPGNCKAANYIETGEFKEENQITEEECFDGFRTTLEIYKNTPLNNAELEELTESVHKYWQKISK